ncbi:MAG TPA: hypothetical protein VFX61_19765 [Micromonosporaceae bacterium]|nr:hypothetical protein [Micromonosporaceae bacterium]
MVPILLTAAGVIAILAKAKSIRATLLQFACGITGCSTAGMTTAAWLLITLPLWYAIAGVLLHRVRNKHLRRIYLFGLAPLGALVQLFIPGKGTSWNDIVQGPFDAPVQAGIRWGGLSILLAVLTIGVLGWLVLSEKLRLSLRQSALVVALVSLVPLSVALADASPS